MNPEVIYISGEELQILRLVKRMKQDSIARRLHISQQAYSKMEKAKRIEGDRLTTLIKELGYSFEDLNKIKETLNSFSSAIIVK